jgi:hypothetical protein
VSPNWPTLTALDAPACLLPNGKVVCLGGTTEPDGGDYFSLNPVFLEYDPASSAATLPLLDAQAALPAGNWTWQSSFLLLPTGQLLCSAHSNSIFIYTPDPANGRPHHSWKPAHISVPDCMVPGQSYRLHGTQLNGLSQAVTYGDDAGMATNYPIVRLVRKSSGHVAYAKTHDFSTMGIAKGSRVPEDLHSCTIDIPSTLHEGHYNLFVIANGIASEPVAITIELRCEEHHHFVGKIQTLEFDRFGDFAAFTMESSSGAHRRFDSRESRVEELVRRAGKERSTISVRFDEKHPHRPDAISILW